jgi:hypothetical protein
MNAGGISLRYSTSISIPLFPSPFSFFLLLFSSLRHQEKASRSRPRI